jgi:ABC-type lipoprotein release transport system permease subunit
LKLPFSFFLALRYLKPKRTFVSIITLISMVGVMLGVTVLIVVISVMTGFDREAASEGGRLGCAHSGYERRCLARLA